jgi:hypothetical protein
MQPSHSGFQYFMLCVDDYSRKMWIFCLRKKSEAFETFKSSKWQLRKKLVITSELSAQIEGGNSPVMSSETTYKLMGFVDKCLLHTHRSKMVLSREEIVLSWKWCDA